jgi:uroporphyrinogen-III decarboxylase
LRAEIGFAPNWYCDRLGIRFEKAWHTDVAYREATITQMLCELERRFPGSGIGRIPQEREATDLLTGTFGCTVVAGIFGMPVVYSENVWPTTTSKYLSATEIEELEAPYLDENAFFRGLMAQVDLIAELQGRVVGFINWQGILNNAQRLRGQDIFLDLIDKPELCRHLFDCICRTMIDGMERLQARQRSTGVDYQFATISNCCVNMISPEQYAEFVLPYDKRIGESFDVIGIHNCAWNADPYLEHYCEIGNVGYIDMGLESNLGRARELMGDARRALMYKPTDLADKSMRQIHDDIKRIVDDYAPCDIVVADIDKEIPDEKVVEFLGLCGQYN